jgi:class 3 adenylate cyclase
VTVAAGSLSVNGGAQIASTTAGPRGIHTSSAMVGNIRTRARLKYGAQGDVLNTGGRLDTLNKTIGTRVCVSGDTVSKARQHRFLIPN